ncbi:MAG: hypothetical protein U5N26_04885 [Candidatus Marinimicrobia bacterium]|nr:hypothetical protein [Candidatus Neomarinimicrobiota bacterium]
MADRKKAHRRHLPVFFIILFIGLSGLFITKTEFGFNVAYKVLKNYLKRDLGYTLSISDLDKRLDTRLRADKLEFTNDDSSLVFSIDTTNIHYSGIFELLGKRRVDSLRLQKPEIYIRSKGRSDKAPEITGLNFPGISIGHIILNNAKVEIETPDTLFSQTVDHAEFSYSGAGARARFDIHDMRMENKALDLRLHTMSSEVTVNNNIAKLRNLCFRLNEAEFNSSGKIRFTDSLRFQFLFSIRDIRPARYYEHRLIDPGDKLSVKLELMGSLKAFYAALNISGSINRKTIRQANVNIEYKDDYLHILEASFKNEDTDISMYGSYGIKDKYLTSTFTSYELHPSAWFPDLPEFAFQGRMRASGYMNKRMSANYNFQCLDLYGIDESRIEGNVFVDEMRDIILDSTNYIYLPDGVLKARGKITGLDSADLDIYGDIADLGPLGPEAGKDLKMKNILLTLRVLGELKDPDVQLNLNVDTFAYDRYSVNDLNLSLYGSGIFSEPGGAVLLSFDDATVDSFLIGNVQTYVRMDGDTVNVDYFDISHENYSLSLSGSARDFTTFTLNSMQGRYMNEDVYLLDSVSFPSVTTVFPFRVLIFFTVMPFCTERWTQSATPSGGM